MIDEQPKSNAQVGSRRMTRLDKALYEDHLLIDKIVGLTSATPHERFEAFALSVREFLARRWVDTESTYARENPKRVYYLSMEFLIGRSLANNVTNLLLDADARRAVKEIDLDWLAILEQERDAGLGNGGLGRLAACFLDSMAHLADSSNGLWAQVRVRHVQASHP
jgi:starch phosphorylase